MQVKLGQISEDSAVESQKTSRASEPAAQRSKSSAFGKTAIKFTIFKVGNRNFAQSLSIESPLCD